MKKVHNCVGVSVDITSVNLGKRDSILTRVLEKPPAILRVPCHIVHNTCMKAAEKFNRIFTYVIGPKLTWKHCLFYPQFPQDTLSVSSNSPGHIMRFAQNPRGHNLHFSPDPHLDAICRPPWTQFVFQPRPPWTQFVF